SPIASARSGAESTSVPSRSNNLPRTLIVQSPRLDQDTSSLLRLPQAPCKPFTDTAPSTRQSVPDPPSMKRSCTDVAALTGLIASGERDKCAPSSARFQTQRSVPADRTTAAKPC